MSEPSAPHHGALHAYQGYEYQIDVTIWVALQLMLGERVQCERIEVEPASEEDIEAELAIEPEEALATLGLPGRRQLQIQVKLRSRPFLSHDFKNLLSPRAPQRTRRAGPVPRSSPIEYLRSHDATVYVLITSAQVDPKLVPHLIQHLEEQPAASELPFSPPPRLKLSSAEKAGLALRLGILHQRTPEIVGSELRRLLRDVAYVPSGRLDPCVQELKACVRDRLLRRAARAWTWQELHRVIQKHDGLPRHPHEKFVKPGVYNALLQRLEQKSTLILVGTRGVGKSATAEVLTYEHRVRSNPFEIVRPRASPAEFQSYLERPGRHLFLLEDPWGATSLSSVEADIWAKELPYLLSRASPDKRFLITSRKGIFTAAFSQRVPTTLKEATVELRPQDYGDEERWQVLMQTLHGNPVQEDFATAHREDILTALEVPYSLRLFGFELRQREAPDSSDLKALLHRSLMETLGDTVATEVRSWPDPLAQAGMLIGFLLQIRWAFSEEDADQVVQSLRDARLQQTIEFQAALKRLLGAGWVEQREGYYWAHPEASPHMTPKTSRKTGCSRTS